MWRSLLSQLCCVSAWASLQPSKRSAPQTLHPSGECVNALIQKMATLIFLQSCELYECKSVACVLLILFFRLQIDSWVGFWETLRYSLFFDIHWNVLITVSWGTLLSWYCVYTYFPFASFRGYNYINIITYLLNGTESFSGVWLSWQEQGYVVYL